MADYVPLRGGEEIEREREGGEGLKEEEEEKKKTGSSRLASLDVFRGLSIAVSSLF